MAEGRLGAEVEALERRVEECPEDVDAWIRWITLVWRRAGWVEARRVMHRGWAHLRGSPEGEGRYRQLLLSAFDLVGDPELARTTPLRDFALTADGSRLFLGGADHWASLLERATGRVLARCEGFAGGVHLARLDAAGRRGLTVGGDGTAHLWELPDPGDKDVPQTARRLWPPRTVQAPEARLDAYVLAGHPLRVRGDLAPAGTHAVLGRQLLRLEGVGGWPVRLRELDEGEEPLGFLGEGEILATIRGPELTLVEVESGRVRSRTGLSGGEDLEVAWMSRDGRHLARVRRRAPSVEVLALGEGDDPGKGWLRSLVRRLRSVKLRGNPASWRCFVRKLPGQHVTAGGFSPDGEVLAVALHPPRVVVFRSADGAVLAELDELEETVRALRLVPGERRVAVAQRRHVRLLAYD